MKVQGADQFLGLAVRGATGGRIGVARRFFFSPADQYRAEWVLVATSWRWFGWRLVPAGGARPENNELQVAFVRRQVRSSPAVPRTVQPGSPLFTAALRFYSRLPALAAPG